MCAGNTIKGYFQLLFKMKKAVILRLTVLSSSLLMFRTGLEPVTFRL